MLSNEIYLDIFQYVPKSVLKTCLTVCRNWYFLLGPLYYQEVCVSESEMKIFWMLIQHQDSDLVNWVKKLIICKSYKEPKYMSPRDYHQLLSSLINLEKIYIQQSVHTVWYLEHLLTVSSAIKIKEIKLLNNTRSHYNDNNRYLDERMAHWYTLNTVKLCSTITHLEINSFPASYFPHENREQRFLEYLSCFEHLTHLKIENLLASGIPSLSFIVVLSHCHQRLQEFDFLSEHAQQEEYCGMKETVNENPNLQVLKLQVPSMPGSHISYLAQYIPEHLRDLSVITTRSFLPNTTDMLLRRARPKRLKLQMKGKEPWHDERDSTPLCIRRFWHTMNTIIASRQRHLDIDIDILLDHFNASPETSITLVNNCVRFTMSHTDPYTYYGQTCTDPVLFLGLQSVSRLNSFVLKERGSACLNTGQLILLLKQVMEVNPTYVKITSEPFSGPVISYNSFMPIQSTSLLLSGNNTSGITYGVLENIYFTQELMNVLGPSLESIKLIKCRYKKDSKNNGIDLNMYNIKNMVMSMNAADTESINEFGIHVISQGGGERHYYYHHDGKQLRTCDKSYHRKSNSMAINIQCKYLTCFQFEVPRGLCLIYP